MLEPDADCAPDKLSCRDVTVSFRGPVFLRYC